MVLKTLVYLILIIAILGRPDATFRYAYMGLYQWASKMVPTLFPFMMISSIMVYSGADRELGNMLGIILKKIYRYSSCGLYAVFMGFFCGFPMGAKVVGDLFENGRLDRQEADTLIAFSNNIGPAYFMGIIIPILHECGYQNAAPFLFGMYGIPAVYGIVLSRFYPPRHKADPFGQNIGVTKTPQSLSFSATLKKSCIDNTQALIVLGGYITFTNAFRILLDFLPVSSVQRNILSSFLEITGGVQAIYTTALPPGQKVFWIMTALCFGGISCIMQTSGFLEKAGLSIYHYLKHKIIVTAISAAYYFMLTGIL